LAAAAAVVAQGAGPLNQTRLGMTQAEALVLVLAVVLVIAVFVEGTRGTLTPWVGVLLLTFAMLAVAAALLHILAR
jgi:uncharacterized membrane protein